MFPQKFLIVFPFIRFPQIVEFSSPFRTFRHHAKVAPLYSFGMGLPTNRPVSLVSFGIPKFAVPSLILYFRASLYSDEHPISRLISQGNRLFFRFQAGQTRSAHFSIKYEQFETGTSFGRFFIK